MIDRRHKEIQKKKPSFIKLVIASSLWLSILFIIYFINPNTFAIIPVFFLLIFLAIFYTSLIFLKKTRRGLTLALALTLFLILRFFGIGNTLNLILLTAIAITIEVYFWYTKSS